MPADKSIGDVILEAGAEKEKAHALLAHRRASQTARELRSVLSIVEKQRDALAEQNELLLSLAEHTPRPFKIKPQTKKERASGLDRGVAVALASDWHVGERVRRETVNGLNEYNPEIAMERARVYFRNFHRLIDIQRGGARIKEAVLWLGGDFISNYIHPELMEENFLSPTEEIELVFDALVGGIDYLLREADLETLLIPTSFGNHGRTTEKKRVASSYRNSHEYALYVRLAKHYAGESRAQFHISQGALNILELGEVRLRFSHGDDLRYAGGVGGLMIPINKAIDQWNKQPPAGEQLPRPVDFDFFGHWHQYLPGPRSLINSSLIGYNAYAVHIKAAYEEAQQAFCLVNLDGRPGQRVYCHHPIRVT